MNQPFTRKIILYSSLFITLALNSARLFALHRDGFFAKLVPFDGAEWIIQILINFIFCLVVFYYNRKDVQYYFTSLTIKLHGKLLLVNLFLIVGFAGLGAIISRQFFKHGMLPGAGYFTRITISFILIAIIFRVITAIYNAQLKERENQQLKNDNLQMELELLKSQLNPHFFFNALSSLSGIVREDPKKAQAYIGHLSKTFRYTLHRPGKDLVTLKEELEDIHSYAELLKMRYEEGFEMKIDIEDMLLQRQLQYECCRQAAQVVDGSRR
jgi:two-component system, LytTR family, sensor kinase